MNVEQKYNEMVQRARELHESGNALTKLQMEIICPELRESEDERIRKELLAVINDLVLPDEQMARFNAYLEKQKEQKSAEQGIDVTKMSALLAADRLASAEMTGRLKERKEILENPEKYGLCKSVEWSDKDEKMIKYFHELLDHAFKNWTKFEGNAVNALNWLKSIRPQPKKEWSHYIWAPSLRFNDDALIRYEDNGKYELVHAGSNPQRAVCGDYILIKDISPYLHWKPSEEQLDALKEASVSWMNEKMGNAKILESLYEQLKAL